MPNLPTDEGEGKALSPQPRIPERVPLSTIRGSLANIALDQGAYHGWHDLSLVATTIKSARLSVFSVENGTFVGGATSTWVGRDPSVTTVALATLLFLCRDVTIQLFLELLHVGPIFKIRDLT